MTSGTNQCTSPTQKIEEGKTDEALLNALNEVAKNPQKNK